MFALGITPDGSVGRGKASLSHKGQFPTPQDQETAFRAMIEKMEESGVAGLRAMTKYEFLSQITGAEVNAYGSKDYLAYDPAVEPGEYDLHAPVTLDMEIFITDGVDQGSIELSLGNKGCFVSQQFIKNCLDEVVAESMPPGYRLMTKREFFDLLVAQASAGLAPKLAMPGAQDFEPLA